MTVFNPMHRRSKPIFSRRRYRQKIRERRRRIMNSRAEAPWDRRNSSLSSERSQTGRWTHSVDRESFKVGEPDESSLISILRDPKMNGSMAQIETQPVDGDCYFEYGSRECSD